MIDIRRTQRDERERVAALLAQAELLALPDWMRLANLLVAIGDNGEVVGAIALEVRARRGLVLSAVVDPEHRRRGVGSGLVHAAISRASELGLRELYLVTENAAGFFERFGFRSIDRDDVPDEIRRTSSFAEDCPEGAAALCLELETRL